MTMSSYEKTVWPAVLHCERVMNVIKIYNVCNKKVFMLDFFVEKRLSMLYVCVLDCACSIFKGLFVFVYSKWIHFVKQINVIW